MDFEIAFKSLLHKTEYDNFYELYKLNIGINNKFSFFNFK